MSRLVFRFTLLKLIEKKKMLALLLFLSGEILIVFFSNCIHSIVPWVMFGDKYKVQIQNECDISYFNKMLCLKTKII